MNKQANLEFLTDLQKLWLSQISYLDINEIGRKKILEEGLRVLQLKSYIDNPNDPFVGNASLGNEKFNSITNALIGKNAIPTNFQVVDELLACGLGNLIITNISSEQKATSSGFQALTFKDYFDNIGISYRGSDLDFSRGGARDWLESDILEYFINDSTQRKEALEYFNNNKTQKGKNYIYGHSLGGNLTSHVYLEHFDEIEEAFVINGNLINQGLIDTPEKKAAFNDSKKYNCNIICGDIVSHFKSSTDYENNINYIKNNDSMKPSFLSSHLVQAALIDSKGYFVKTTKQEMIDKMGSGSNKFMNFFKRVREIMNKMGNKYSKSKSND